MRSRNLIINSFVIASLILLGGRSLAENFSAEELRERAIERRAIEAVIWGMPAGQL